MSAGKISMMRWRYVWRFGALAAVWMLLLLVGPRYPQPIVRPMSYRNVDLPGPFALSLSVDSPQFMRLALAPSLLLKPHELRQSRPGMVLAASPLALALAQVGSPPMVAGFLAFMILHLATLVASFAVYLRIVEAWSVGLSPLVFLAGLLLLFNDVTTYFVLSPHTALFNILAPLACLWVADRAWRHDLLHDRRVLGVALLSGVGFVCYGSFLLALPSLLLPAAVRDWNARRGLGLAFLGRAALVSAVFFLTFAAWYALVVWRNGAFYSAEVEVFRMFVWMADGVRTHGWQWVAAKLLALARLGAGKCVWMALPAAVVVAVGVLLHPRRRELWRELQGAAVVATAVSVLLFVFFVLSGFVYNRSMFSCAVVYVPLAGACIARAGQALPATRIAVATYAFALVAVGYGAFVLLRDVTRPVYLG